jgi:hypothetical protein
MVVLGLVTLSGPGCGRTLSEEEPGAARPENAARRGRLSVSSEASTASWIRTSNLAQGRVLHTAASLLEGRVLVAGGYNRASEVYDPATGTWTRTGDTLVSRRAHTMNTLQDGRVLMVGGEGCQASTSSEVYDPTSGTWKATGPLNTCRAHHASVLLPSGRVLVVGGTDGTGRVLASAEVYDPTTGTWTSTSALGTARTQSTATLLTSGRVLVAGGDNGGLLASAEVYDPATGTWTSTGAMGQPRRYHTATLLPSGEVLVTGSGGERGPAASAEVYDPTTGAWTATGAMGQPRRYHTALLLPSGGVLVAGGYHDSTGISSTAEVYDPGTRSWSATAPLNVSRYRHTLTALRDGRMLVAGGFSAQDQSSAELYVSTRSSPGGVTEPSGTSLLLEVLDASGQPIPSAAVSLGDGLLPTDGAGRLLLQPLPPGRFTTRVDAPGYASATVSVELSEGLNVGARVRLLPVGTAVPFLAENGVSVQHQGVSVSLPAHAVVDADGQPVSGPVQLLVTALDPTLGLATLPGPLEGVASASGERVPMESIFMAEVSLRGQEGQPLQLAPGAHATLEFPLPAALAARFQPGDTIPAWWLDLDRGLWVEEGAGTVRTTDDGRVVWVVQVAHFTWWNADKPYDTSCVNVTVRDALGMPVANVPVIAVGKDYAGSNSNYTGMYGTTCVMMKRGGTADVQVGHPGAPVGGAQTVTSTTQGLCGGNSCQSLTIVIPKSRICIPGASTSCPYNGPAGVGICRAGTNTCDTLGMSWSGCQGQVLPAATDNCATVFDDNCDGAINESCGQCTFGSTEACYSGPQGTLCPAGTSCPYQWCSAGTRTCDRSGHFGACLDQKLPAAKDTCATTVDDNCDGSTECNDIYVWSRRFGDAACQEGLGVAADTAGNVIISGLFQGTVGFGGPTFSSAGGNDAFVAKLNANGNHVWSHHLGNPGYAISLEVATDGAGNTLVAGVFNGVLLFDGAPLLTSTGATDSFVVKLDAGGNLLKATVIGGPGPQEAWGIAADSLGDVLVAGRNWDTLTVNGIAYPTSGDADAFVVKLGGADLSPKWTRNWGAAGTDTAEGVDTDTNQNILLTGRFTGTVSFGGPARVSKGGADAFVVKLDANGNWLWDRAFGAAGTQLGADVQVDGANNVVVAGGFDGTNVDFGGPPLSSKGDWDIFLLKLDANGVHRWSKGFGGPSADFAEGVAVSGNGGIAITGELVGPTDLGGGPRTGHGGLDSFVAYFDQNGAHRWSQVHGDLTEQAGLGITFDSMGNVLVIGDMEGRVRFGQDLPSEQRSNGCYDVFLLKLKSTP